MSHEDSDDSSLVPRLRSLPAKTALVRRGTELADMLRAAEAQPDLPFDAAVAQVLFRNNLFTRDPKGAAAKSTSQAKRVLTLFDLSENIRVGDVLRVLVKIGDTLAKDQTVIELETGTVTVDVPSSVGGRVTAVSVRAGDNINACDAILTVIQEVTQEVIAAVHSQVAESRNFYGKLFDDHEPMILKFLQENPDVPFAAAVTHVLVPKAQGAGHPVVIGAGEHVLTLPDLGENITTVDVLRVLVKPGDTLAKDQPVLELETEKATIEVPLSAIIEVPFSVAVIVKAVNVKTGHKIKVGQAILTIIAVPESGSARRTTTEDS